MKRDLFIGVALAALFTLAVFTAGFLLGGWVKVSQVRGILEAAASAEGFEGGARIRHAVIGGITNVTVYPDHLAASGTKGTRQWWP